MMSSAGPEIVVTKERWVPPEFMPHEKSPFMQVPLTLPCEKQVELEKLAEPVTEDPLWVRERERLPPLVPLELTHAPAHCPVTSTAGAEFPTLLLPLSLPPCEQLAEQRTMIRPNVIEARLWIRQCMIFHFQLEALASAAGTLRRTSVDPHTRVQRCSSWFFSSVNAGHRGSCARLLAGSPDPVTVSCAAEHGPKLQHNRRSGNPEIGVGCPPEVRSFPVRRTVRWQEMPQVAARSHQQVLSLR